MSTEPRLQLSTHLLSFQSLSLLIKKVRKSQDIPGYPTVDDEQPKVEIPGYRFVETKKLPNGDIEHVYEQVTTSYVDENGTPIPGYPSEDGQQPKKEIPGYEFVKTIVDENGNTQHIYK